MTSTRHLILAICCLGLSTSGCAVPYFASVRGPIRSVRVLDAETGADVPEATVSLQSQMSKRFLGPPSATLTCPDLSELQAGAARGRLLRNTDQSFHMSAGLGMGSHGYLTGRPEDPNEYPRGVVVVAAAGYRPALLRYTVGHIEPGWFCVEKLDPDDSAAATNNPQLAEAAASFQGGRCDLGADGVLRFHLRPLERGASAIPSLEPARTTASPVGQPVNPS
jgi:hypothetical protein